MKHIIIAIIISLFLCTFVQAETQVRTMSIDVGKGLWGIDYENQTRYRAGVVDENGCLWTNCYANEVALGIFDNVSSGFKFGAGTIGTTLIEVWDGNTAYNWLDSAVQLKVSSSDVDDAVGGTGGETIEIFGLDENFVEISEEVSLNGQTIETTAQSFYRVYRVIVKTAGSSETNEGDIYIHNSAVVSGVPSDATKIYAKVLSLNGQTLMSVFTVPAGKKMMINLFHASVGEGKDVKVNLFVKPFGGAWAVKCFDYLFQAVVDIDLIYPLVYDEKSDVAVKGISTAAGNQISAKWQYILIDKE